MDFSDWLKAERGRAARLAADFGVTESAVCQWQVDGVPRARMLAVRDATCGVVTLEEMLAFASVKAGHSTSAATQAAA
jgi:hypothetical protein